MSIILLAASLPPLKKGGDLTSVSILIWCFYAYPHPLHLGRQRRPVPLLSRHGVGGAGARRPPALRVPDPGGGAGRAFLDHHPEKARGVPARLRRTGPGSRGEVQRVAALAVDAGLLHRQKPAEALFRRGKRPRLSCAAGGVRLFRRLPLALCRRRPAAKRLAQPRRDTRRDRNLRCPEPRPEKARLPLRREHHLLRLHAGGRHGE